MQDSIEEIFNSGLPFCFGQILIQKRNGTAFVLSHRDDASLGQSQTYGNAEAAAEIAKFDDQGNYRPLKTAPNLRHAWRLELSTIEQVRRALDYFYPGRLATFRAWQDGCLATTALRETLKRQTGMYRIAATISDAQINDVVADFCRSDTGCLRTILWKRDRNGAVASTKLPSEKFDPAFDQTSTSSVPGSTPPATIPLLCQEACNLLVAECRKVVKSEKS